MITLRTGEEIVTITSLAAPITGCLCGDERRHGGVWLCELVDGTFVEAFADELMVSA